MILEAHNGPLDKIVRRLNQIKNLLKELLDNQKLLLHLTTLNCKMPIAHNQQRENHQSINKKSQCFNRKNFHKDLMMCI